MNYTLKQKQLELTISSLGAEPISIKYFNKERLWQNEDGSWPRHAPILFPFAGEYSLIVDGIAYKNGRHGFARDLEFQLVSKTENCLTLVLKSNEITKTKYPFDFLFYATYHLNDNTIDIEYNIVNSGNKKLYFCIGTHESYALNDEVKNYNIEFEKEEDFLNIDSEQNVVANLGHGQELSLNTKYLDNANTITLHNIHSRKVTLKTKKGLKVASVVFPDVSNLLLWHPKNTKMICIEPWLNLPDRKIDVNKEFKDKDNIICLEPKGNKLIHHSLIYFNNL